ncbi:hypothetical protein BR10RB9215_C10844 [Brucella sp. 10RB9215]|uniref:hypothetical protein n=1 Tax=Brucella sp. 10RB9215 TaxID=1149953 RepID=UPI00090B446D|nr:hypothetical protein BR10RB9215_C10844 [Brucella sp. 10RB9215]
MTVRTIDEIFRDFVIDGVPASGPFNPHKPDIRDTLKVLLEGVSTFPDNRVIRLNNADEGTANNIVVTSSVAIPTAAYQVLYILNVTQVNTGPVTVSGAINRSLVTNINQPIAPGYLIPGMAVLCVDTGTELRLLSYGDAEAEQAAAEAAADRAEDAAAGGLLSNFASRADVEITNIPALVTYLRTAGYYAAGDGGAALYQRSSSEPSHAGKVQSADGAWWELASATLTPHQFGELFYSERIDPVAGSVSPAYKDLHFGVEYSSSSTEVLHYGYTANIKRTGGNKSPVGAQLNAYDLSPSGSVPNTSVWGATLEAWSGDHDSEPNVPVILIGIEPAIIQQRHDSDLGKVGLDVVFKNRKDGGTLLHGSIGSNKYNKGAKAITITSQSRSPFGEFCGWKTGIDFSSTGLDLDIDGGAVAIDVSKVDFNRLDYAFKMGPNHSIGWSSPTRSLKIRWLEPSDRVQILDGEIERIGFGATNAALFFNGIQVVGIRSQGWTASSGAATKGGFNSGTVTLPELAQNVKAIIDALLNHGLIGE